jgi:predicted ATPase/transcriptional regulator with XRE-family HTH domain/uncharacterized protein HemY
MAAKDANAFGALLRQHRTRAGLTQEELAEHAGLSVRGLVYLEHGTRRPYPDTLQRLAEALALTPVQRDALADATRSTHSGDENATLNLPPLPSAATPLIGREREVADVAALLGAPGVRLVTLTGPGGTGKTRLSLAVAAALVEDFAGGVAFVPLAVLTDPELVLPAIVAALGVKVGAGESPTEAVRVALRDRLLLLVLDNVEQVVAAAPDVAELLALCPGITLLVTSRAALHVRGEHEFAVPPMRLPDPHHLPPLEALGEYEAIRLFVDRAQAIKPDFRLTEANARTVAGICDRLDGLPLAIELAAARIRTLTPAALLARLAKSLTMLTGGARDLPARQQTLRDTIRWSYDLLTHDERMLFRRLAVFVNGCTLEAIEAVCDSEGNFTIDLLDSLESLISQSLVRRGEGRDGEARYTMLQTIRAFCIEQLDARGETESLRERHAAYFLAVAEEGGGEIELHGARQDVWLDRLEEEHDNLRAALDWSLLRRPGEMPLRFASALGPFWQHHGYYNEGLRRLEACLAAGQGAPDALRADVLNHLGAILTRQSEFERARPHLESGLVIGRTLGDQAKIARALKSLGLLAQYQGDYATARTYDNEALTIYQALGNRNGIGGTLNNLGIIAFREADYAQARDLYEQSLAQHRMQGDQSRVANAFNNLALIAHLLGDYPSARRLHEEGLAILRHSGEKPTIAMSLTNLGFVCADAGDAGAEEMLREGLALYREFGNRLGAARAQLYLELARHYQDERAASYDVLDECLATLRTIGEKQDVADALMALGRVAVARGEFASAHVHLRDALTIAREFNDQPRIAQHIEIMAMVAARQEAVPRAARLWGAAESVRRGIGIELAGVHAREHDREIALAQSRIEAALWLVAWQEGAAMALDRAVAEALA